MASTFYNVAITALTGSTNGGGFIDNKKIEHHMLTDDGPSDADESRDKERANIRFDTMVAKLGLLGNLYMSNVVATGANSTTDASSFTFTVESEHGDSTLYTEDENNSGVYLTGNAAIKRSVARALIIDRNDFGDYYDPTMSNAVVNSGETVSAVRVGTRIEHVIAGALANSIANAEAAITVTKI
jgi:hypothetical protein